MNIHNNKVFISGGTAGIGLAIATALHKAGNQLLINGRNSEKLAATIAALPGSIAIQGDMGQAQDRERIADWIRHNHPDTNWLINNAGLAYAYSLGSGVHSYNHAQQEINLNYLSIVHFTELLLPQLHRMPNSAIINVTSIAALRSTTAIPTYAASKAALRSYTTALRQTFSEHDALHIFELLPPLVNTAFSKEIGGAIHGIPPEEVATALLEGLRNNRYEIPVGITQQYMPH